MLADEPALVVVDLQAEEFAAPTLIRQAAAGGAAVLAFGRHTEPGVLKAARDAGADRAVPRSQVADELPALLDELLAHPAPGPLQIQTEASLTARAIVRAIRRCYHALGLTSCL